MTINKTFVRCILLLLGYVSFSGCSSKKTESSDIIFEKLDTIDEYDVSLYINSVKGHDERDTIVGNFTGDGIDTLYVERVVECKCNSNKDYDEE